MATEERTPKLEDIDVYGFPGLGGSLKAALARFSSNATCSVLSDGSLRIEELGVSPLVIDKTLWQEKPHV
jgi:hypothetical protein